jgi:ABC-2 type transport system ATP-binding protein
MSPPLIEAHGLSRWYGPVVGLNDLELTVEGGIVGLLGPNGAGKSTFLKLVAGEIRPSRGTLRVLGHDPFANREYFRALGFVPQQDSLYDELSALEFVEFLARLSGLSAREAHLRSQAALERTGMGGALHRPTRGFSKGMRQRTKLAAALVHAPQLLVVDEPLTGLDPLGRREMVALFQELGREGVHILISSHVLHEIESVTENIVLLHRSRLLAQGRVADIRALLNRYPHRYEIRAARARALASALLTLPATHSARVAPDGLGLTLETFAPAELERELPRILGELKPGLESLEGTDVGLDAVFDYLVA